MLVEACEFKTRGSATKKKTKIIIKNHQLFLLKKISISSVLIRVQQEKELLDRPLQILNMCTTLHEMRVTEHSGGLS